MLRTRLSLVASFISATFVFSLLPANSASIAGTLCTKLNSTKTISNIKYTCVKSGKKLVWNKGALIHTKVSQTPTPTPTSSTEPTPEPTSKTSEIKVNDFCSSADQGAEKTITTGKVVCKKDNYQTFRWLPVEDISKNADPRTSAQRFEISPANAFQPIQVCNQKTLLMRDQTAGFPRSANLIPTLGSVRSVTIFTQYTDLPADDDQVRVWRDQQIPTAEKYFKIMSYGKLDFKVDLVEKIYMIQKSVLSYNLDTAHGTPMKSNADTFGLIRDAVTAADGDIDFSKYDFINVITPATTKIGFEGATGLDLTVDGKTFHQATFGPIREYKDDPVKYAWLVHETGHLMGLLHPYNVAGVRSKGHFAIPAWDLMGNAITFAPEFLAWNKYLLGWLDQSQINCLEASKPSETISLITPISDNTSGIKAAFVKISETELLAIENRRNSEVNHVNREDEGVFVYVVHQDIADNYGAVDPLWDKESVKSDMLLGTLKPGDSITYKNISVTLKSSAVEGDFVAIKIT